LDEASYTENRTVAFEYRWADSEYDRLPALAKELVQHGVDVILASGPPAAIAVKAATTTIPVIFVVGFDPVAAKLVGSLNRPGGNLTGMYLYIGGLVAKKIELLREMAPDLGNFAVAVNPGTPSAKLDSAEADAARVNGNPVSIVNVSSDADIDATFNDLASRKAGVVVGTDTFFFANRAHLAAAAAKTGVPTISYAREFVTAGGLMSYGANIPDIYRQTGVYVARVLRGEKPSEMPVQLPTKFELVINVGAAKALDLKISLTLSTIADEVIE
jgi:putative tryptophan/tyrosine transport system substrate-binding protein